MKPPFANINKVLRCKSQKNLKGKTAVQEKRKMKEILNNRNLHAIYNLYKRYLVSLQTRLKLSLEEEIIFNFYYPIRIPILQQIRDNLIIAIQIIITFFKKLGDTSRSYFNIHAAYLKYKTPEQKKPMVKFQYKNNC